MCIALSYSAFPKARGHKTPCAGRWEKIAGIGSQAATNEQAPQGVRDCPSLVLLQQVWNQHFEQIDGLVRWRDGPLVANAERVGSPYETDARESRKRDTEWMGYKVHLTETCGEEAAVHLIVQAQITVATEQDVEETMPLLHDLQARDLVPEVRLVDSGYVSGVRCPQGQLSQNWCPGRHNHGEEVIRVSFSAVTCQACQACPVKELCTKREKHKGRILTLSPQRVHEERLRRRTEQDTPAFQQRYALRSGIEGSLSEGIRRHGLRRARYRGQSKTQLQATAIAAAINLVRIRQMLQRTQLGLSPRPKRPLSPFARLRSLLAA